VSGVKDFDAAWKEKDDEGYKFKVKGREYELPPSVPAGVMLDSVRLHKEYDDEDEIPTEDLIEIATKMIGEDEVDQMVEDGISTDELGDIIMWANETYQNANEEETEGDDSGN
jgi:predicted alpha-1,6-mannanase (GH76 family)